ncbi:MAG TPA: transketolase, partial [Ilumatobacteraceae bacterium]|nr:transketolase [Ilumatobacteraceae bacterium]
TWSERDRFILSKGHGAGALYISMANRGFFDVEEIYDTYGGLGSRFGMHPCRNHLPGVETSTGSLGHGLSVAVGLALAARLDARTNRVVTLIGDGELNEGTVWEAVMAAAHFRLGSIVAFIDKNDMTMDGATDDIMRVNPVDAKFAAFRWHVVEVDGHDVAALVDVIDGLPDAGGGQPTVVVAHTVKGRGIGFMENTTKWHSGQIDDATLEQCYAELSERYGAPA